MTVMNAVGNMIQNPDSFTGKLALLSVGNLGYCPEGSCLTDEQITTRQLYASSQMKVLDVSEFYGILDGVAVLIFFAFGLGFAYMWIPRVVRMADAMHTTAADFAVQINGLPRRIDDSHENYKAVLTKHIQSVLDTRGCEGSIAEVTLVRDYDGALKTFKQVGELDLQREDASEALRFATMKGDTKAIEEQQTRLDTVKATIHQLESRIDTQSRMKDVERDVVTAFVMFTTEATKAAVLDEYSYAAFALFRVCQSKRLRFFGRRISVQQACEPADLNWENLDYSKFWLAVRKIIIGLLTFLLLVACSLLLVVAQSMKTTSVSAPPSSKIWVISSTLDTSSTYDPACLKLCSLKLFSNRECVNQDMPVSRIFNSAGNISADSLLGSLSKCASAPPIQSEYCKQLQGQASVVSGADWVAVEFSSEQSVRCVKAEYPLVQNSIKTPTQLFACGTEVFSQPLNNTWRPQDSCLPMHAAQHVGGAISGRSFLASIPKLEVNVDTTCSTPISYEAARISQEKTADGGIGLVLSCFCEQQAREHGYTFRLRSKTDAEKICSDWSKVDLQSNAKMVGGIIAVLVLNQVHTFINSYFVEWEKPPTITLMLASRMFKAFFSLFVNTGLLTLIVNVRLQKVSPVVNFLQFFGIGTGSYEDMNKYWYVSVGSSIFITIFTQVASATTPGLVMSFIANPFLIRFYTRNVVSQKLLNQAYVYPEFDLARRLAQTLNVIFCILMYSSGMPALYFVGFIYCLVAFWLDKWCLLRGSKRPAAVNEKIIQKTVHLFIVGVFFHTFFALWSFGDQAILPSDYGVLSNILMSILGMDREQASEARETFLYGTAEEKEDGWHMYAKARMVDCSRKASWLLFIIFVVFVAVKILEYLSFYLLEPVFAACEVVVRNCCCGSKQEHHNIEPLDEAIPGMNRVGLLTSYCMSENPRFSQAYEILTKPRKDGRVFVESEKPEMPVKSGEPLEARDAGQVGRVGEAIDAGQARDQVRVSPSLSDSGRVSNESLMAGEAVRI
eukprot:TRINITY_DN3758_c0_g1_i2.p1 TRINITY_DN3758_c0_g1~~TRINITY_DN3758_c0_g1_i2.p1  ORF type:complete len:1138 (-),score=156.37 TRINITY_DN3758_c0_g1_i2:68-3109(-)